MIIVEDAITQEMSQSQEAVAFRDPPLLEKDDSPKSSPQTVLDVDEELLKRIESVLFAAGKKVPLEDIAKLCNKRGESVLIEAGLRKLKERYEVSDSSLMVVQDGPAWKLTVKERFLPFVRKIVTQTELKKSVMETLAVIAYKNPIMQSELIRVRTNKAYDHLGLLEEEGYINRKKVGRTKEVSLAPKFFEYFDLPEEALRERFKSVQELESQVNQAEASLKERKKEIQQAKDDRKAKEQADKDIAHAKVVEIEQSIKDHPAIEILDEKGLAHELEVYTEPVEKTDEPVSSEVKILRNRLGELDIVSTKPKIEIVGGKVVALGEMVVEGSSIDVPESKAKTPEEGDSEPKAGEDVDRRVAEILGGFGSSPADQLLEKSDEALNGGGLPDDLESEAPPSDSSASKDDGETKEKKDDE